MSHPKKVVILLLVALSVTSCATIVSRKTYTAKFSSDVPNARAKINDSIYNLPAKVRLQRSEEDLPVTLITDTLTKDFILKAGHSPQFAFGNLIFMQLSPVGYGIDYTNKKRFYYGKSIDLDIKDSATVLTPLPDKLVKRYMSQDLPPADKGQIFAEFSIPIANHFYMQPRNEPKKSLYGMFGISAGLSYYYRNNKYLYAGASLATDWGPDFYMDFDGAVQSAYAANFTVTDNFQLKRFTVGYGLNYAIYTWKLSNNDYTWPPNQEPVMYHSEDLRPSLTKRNHAFGATANLYHQINKFLHIGLIYSPTFYSTFPSSGFMYQHAISLDLRYKLRLNK
jgi:hypothetical protein